MSGVTEKLTSGQVFGRYQIVRMIGEGGMGAVYEALHTGLKKRVAIKTLLPSIASNAEAQARFLREGEAAARMNHPNVVDVTDVGTELGIPYLVMEYLEGETLADFIARKGPLDVPVAVDLLLPSIAAVAAGHDEGVIHRDLKPQNIFLERGPWGEAIPKVLDFGVSKILGDTGAALTGTMAVLGTASYMSPEQARGARVVDAASDQYAMGLILFEMLTATRAHDGEHPLEVLHRIASGIVPDVRALRPDLPPGLVALMERMLATNPRDRHASLRTVARALLPLATERARINYADAFREPDHALTPVATGPAAPGAGSGVKSGGTRLLPSSGLKQHTTLGQSAAEFSPVPFRTSRWPVLLVGGTLVAGAAVVLFLLKGTGETRGTGEVTQPNVPAARPVAELPAPKPAVDELPQPPPTAPRQAAPAPQVPEASPLRAIADRPDHEAPATHGERHHPRAKKNAGTPRTPRATVNDSPILD